MDASMAYELLTVGSQDHREAMDAMTSKRPPAFTGK
jgi:hypothetical protein